jgi:3-dehydroquinate synthase
VISVEVRVGSRSYLARIGSGLIDEIGSTITKTLGGPRCAIIADSNVAPLFGERARQSLISAGFQPTLITVSAGEQFKTLDQVGLICDQMLAAGLDRQSFVVGLGGGVISDISGFVAAIFQRGIPHVQIPTTLLGMVDSSIGGKTGVNTPDGKNLIGAVHHPALVIDDIDLLKTLPGREFNQGFAEIIKHAVIADAEMFSALQDKKASKELALPSLIQRNIEIKARFIARDEFDRTGERALLNFGHTVGHAIESAGGYQTFLHGEAISLGMVAASAISMKRAGLSQDQRDTIVDLLRAFDLPTRLPENFPRDRILEALKFDKKFEVGEIRFVLTPKIGSARLSREVTMEDIREAVETL